jgi:hypothetical protein
MKKLKLQILITIAILSSAFGALAQGTAFTYQGRLTVGGSNANGVYDLKLQLFDALSAGSLIAGPITNSPVTVSNGLFTIVVDFGGGAFPGASRWLDISVRTNGAAVAFSALTPRQALTPTPYAITSENLDGFLNASQLTGTLPNGLLAGVYGSAVTLNNPANVLVGNGTGITNVNAATLGGLGPNNFWKTIGNAGTVPGINFAGTLDAQAFELRANGDRGLHIDSDTIYHTPNMIGGPVNFAGGGSVGNFIGAGGQATFATNAVLGGGNLNVIVGGWNNIIYGHEGVIGGGQYNTISNYHGTIGGGENNLVSAFDATIPGGNNNVAAGAYSFAAGQNAQALNDGSFVWADDSVNTPFASAFANQFLVRSSFMGLNRSYRVSGAEYFGILAPVTNAYGGMYIQTAGTGLPFYGYADGTGYAWTYLDGSDTNKWKLYNGGYQLTFTADGLLGVGTTTPTDPLTVQGNTRVNDNPIYLRSGSDRNHGIAYSNLVSGILIDGPFIWGYDGGALGGVTSVNPDVVTLHWDWQGNVWISNNCSVATLTIRGGADLAEPFQITAAQQEITEGSVVVIDEENPGHLKLSSSAYDTHVAGVISGANGVNPGIQMQQQGLIEGGKNVALTGRVYVQADASFGAIKPGDLLTTSSTPGAAMKVTNHGKAQGAILGKAMTGLKQGRGMVLVLVTLQ